MLRVEQNNIGLIAKFYYVRDRGISKSTKKYFSKAESVQINLSQKVKLKD